MIIGNRDNIVTATDGSKVEIPPTQPETYRVPAIPVLSQFHRWFADGGVGIRCALHDSNRAGNSDKGKGMHRPYAAMA